MSGLWEIVAPFSADDVNEHLNPSIETGTTGYAAGGTNTIAASTDYQWRGAYSLKCTIADSNVPFSYAHTFLNANTTYYIKLMLYVSSAYSPSIVSLNVSGFSGATLTQVKYWNSPAVTSTQVSTKDAWVELSATIAVASDVTGNISISGSASNIGSVLYFDALYISTNNGLYFDGDSPLAFWQGNRHASASQMDYRNRKHGEATNLDALYVYAGHPVGFDFAPLDVQTRARAIGSGSEFQHTYIGERPAQLPISIVGSSESSYHTRKKAFENLLKPNKSPGQQAFILRSLAANTNTANHLAVRLDGDLSLKREGFTGKGIMRVLATEPSWYEMGDHYAAMTRYTSLSVEYVLGWLNDGTGFSNMGVSGNPSSEVKTMVVAENGDLYLGGIFTSWDGVSNTARIVKYTRSSGAWTSLFTSGAGNTVQEIIILDDGDLVIVGNFTTIGGAAHNYAVRWDGSTLSDFGAGFNGSVNAVAFDYKRGKLYFGGNFTTADGVAAARVAQYTLSTGLFTAMGSGVNGEVMDIYVEPVTGDVYVGGDFTDSGRTRAGRWGYSDQAWHSIGDGDGGEGFDAVVNAITGDGHYIYFGGNMTQTNAGMVGAAIPVKKIARYISGDHTHPEQLGSGAVGGAVNFLYWDTVLSKLLISGAFTSIGTGRLIDNAVYWNGATFELIPLNFPASSTVTAFARNLVNGDYFYGFNTTGTMLVPGALNSITNNGTDDAYPVFVFDSSTDVIGTEYATLTTLANRTTGAVINFNDVRILAGSVVIVEFSPQGCRIYRLVGQSKVDLTNGAIVRDSDVSAFALTPKLNQILLAAMDTSGTPSISCYCLYRHRHHSLSGTAA